MSIMWTNLFWIFLLLIFYFLANCFVHLWSKNEGWKMIWLMEGNKKGRNFLMPWLISFGCVNESFICLLLWIFHNIELFLKMKCCLWLVLGIFVICFFGKCVFLIFGKLRQTQLFINLSCAVPNSVKDACATILDPISCIKNN